MSEVPYSESEHSALEEGANEPPNELPPVQPPSAGFIIQLFVVPGLIVVAIVGLWWLFGKLTSSSQDWRTLVTELRSTNEHRRWRGAHGLAQMLDLDARSGAAGQQLTSNRQIATELGALTLEQLQRGTKSEDDLKHLEFLTKTLGLLETPDIVLPILQKAMQPDQDRDVRKNAIASIALIAGRSHDQGQALVDESLTNDLIAASRDSDSIVKHLTTYALGLMPTDAAKQQLLTLLGDTDPKTRANAAIGLCRQKSTAGLAVFKEVLSQAAHQSSQQPKKISFERFNVLGNSIKAVGDLAGRFAPDERQELTTLIELIAENYPDNRIRIDATKCLKLLAAADQVPVSNL